MIAVERLEPFDAGRFLQQFWQRRPCLISGWLDPLPLTLPELIEAAAEHQLPARLITGTQQRADWTVEHGPIEAGELPESEQDWTVLVQEMDKYSSRVGMVMSDFRHFLPDWMLDDIMVSHAMPGGSVGAHVDAYDVFLVQARGTRRWQLATEFDSRMDERFEMALLRSWRAETELLVGPGETLYLPAGVAHHGVAEDECQTWSVGLRTPSGPELIFFLAESLASGDARNPRLKVTRPDDELAARITPETVRQARSLMEQALAVDDESLELMLGQFLSSWRLWTCEDPADDIEAVSQQLQKKASITLDASARIAVSGPAGRERVFVNGEAIECTAQMAKHLAATRELDHSWLNHPTGLDQLVECGALSLTET